MGTTTAKKRTIGRDTPTFEEALLRAKIIIRPLDDETKRMLIMPKLWKTYLKYLEESDQSLNDDTKSDIPNNNFKIN